MRIYWVCLILLWGVVSVSAQELPFEYVAQRDGWMVFVGQERDIVIREAIPEYQFKGWSPSGRYLMTIITDPSDPLREIMLLNDLTVPEAFPMVTDIDFGAVFPLQFTDEQVIFFEPTYELLVSEDEQGIGVSKVNVHRWSFEEGVSAIELVGAIPYGIGCGGGGLRSAIDQVYGQEVRGDVFGEYNRKTLALTPYGIVHSNSCTAIRTFLTDPTTLEFVEIGDNLRWATVSPDSEWVTGTTDNRLQLFALETLESVDVIEGDAPIYSVTWGDDSQYFYYVVRTHDGTRLPVDDPNGLLEAYDPYMTEMMPRPDDAMNWVSTIYRYDVVRGESTEIHRADAYAIGEMVEVQGTLVFSQVEYPVAWLKVSLSEQPNNNAELIPVTVWQLDLTTEQAVQVLQDVRAIRVRPD